MEMTKDILLYGAIIPINAVTELDSYFLYSVAFFFGTFSETPARVP